MAKKQVGKGNDKKGKDDKKKVEKVGKKESGSSLKRSFAAAAAAEAAPVQKGDQSLFLTYCKSTAASKDATAAGQALRILEDYKQMTSEQKRKTVTNFFKAGGRKAGLKSLFKQVLSTESSAKDIGWRGWATPSMIMSWSGVSLGSKERTKTEDVLNKLWLLLTIGT